MAKETEGDTGRTLLGRGSEQTAFLSKDRKMVLKIPHAYTVRSLHLFFGGIDTVEREINETRELVKGKEEIIRIPETRVFRSGIGRKEKGKFQLLGTLIFKPVDSYIVAMEFVEDDKSVTNKLERLEAANLPEMVARYRLNPDNFISRNGVMYMIDPSLSPWSRFGNLIHKIYDLNQLRITLKENKRMREAEKLKEAA